VRGERGTAVIGSTAGVAVFLVLLLFAVQLLTNLYATTTVTAAGLDAARTVAARDVDHTSPAEVGAAAARAEAGFRHLTGPVGQRAQLSWAVDGETVRLRVRADSPTILPSRWGARLAFGRIDRTFVVRIEDLT
jgi:hypothetical protein